MRRSLLVIWISLFLVFAITACDAVAPASTATPVPPPAPTNTATPVPPTNTPTITPSPTATPDVEATQKAGKFQSLLDEFKEKGYIATTEGGSILVKDFEKEYALMYHYYQWWRPAEVKGEFTNFVFSAHFEWKSYSSTPDASGCGIGFGIKENGDHYAVFLDRANIFFLSSKGSRLRRLGTSGGGTFQEIPIPARADFAIAVWDQAAAVSVNGVIVKYILFSDQDAQGELALSLLSGSNGGYGTRCKMTDIIFWTPK